MGTTLGEPEPEHEPEPVETWSCWENLMLKTIMVEKWTDKIETGLIDWFHVASTFNERGDIHIGSYPYMPKVMTWSSKTPLECQSHWNEYVKHDSHEMIEQACKEAWRPINVGNAPTLGRFIVEDAEDWTGPEDYPGLEEVNDLLMASTGGKVSVTRVTYYNTGAEVTVTSQHETMSKQGNSKGCYEGQITFYDCQGRWWNDFDEQDIIKFEHSKNNNGIKFATVYKKSPPQGTGLNVRSRVSLSNDSQSWFTAITAKCAGNLSLFSVDKLTPDIGIHYGDAGKFRVVFFADHWSMNGVDDDGSSEEDDYDKYKSQYERGLEVDAKKASAAVADITASHPQESTPTKRALNTEDDGKFVFYEPTQQSVMKGNMPGWAYVKSFGKDGMASLYYNIGGKGKHTTKVKIGTAVRFADDETTRELFKKLPGKYKEPEPAPVVIAVEDDGIERTGSDVWECITF